MSLNKLKLSGLEWRTVSTILICLTKMIVTTWVYANSRDCLHLDFLLLRPAMSLWIYGRMSWLIIGVQVKEHGSYQAVASNTSGSTPKELFEDVLEELDKQVY